jgi:hypothetical protein
MYIHVMNIAFYVHEALTSYAAWKAVWLVKICS